VNADEIPQQLIDILDARAGKVHSRQGPVVACLAVVWGCAGVLWLRKRRRSA
jgi:hypothetical protein